MNDDIIIDGSLATWRMENIQGEINGTYNGTFVFKCYLTPLDQIQAGKQYREYLGSHTNLLTDNENNIAFALTQLSKRIVKAPPFWTSTIDSSGIAGNIPDLNIIAIVLERAIQAENLFKERIAKEREELLNRSIEAAEKALHKQAGE